MPRLSKDHVGGAMLIALGLAVAVAGRGYRMGTLTQMGAGYVPVIIGVVLAGLGVAILAGARPPEARAPDALPPILWRPWLCILSGIGAFVVLGTWGGLLPATFVAVFVAALGDRNNSWRSAGVLAAAMTVVAAVLFSWALQVQLPLLAWGNG